MLKIGRKYATISGMKFFTKIAAGAATLGMILFAFPAQAASAISLERGVAAFRAGNTAEAETLLQQAQQNAPTDALVGLWLGLALEANKKPFDAMTAWRAGNGDARWEPFSDYFRAMSWWRMGRATDAEAYFKDALVNLKDGKTVDFAPARNALALLKAGAAAPAVEQWPVLTGLIETTTHPTAEAVKAEAVKPDSPAPKPPVKPAEPPKPKPAQANIGYKPWAAFKTFKIGERVRFRVSNNTWRIGVITDLVQDEKSLSRHKYLILQENMPLAHPEYVYFSDVAALERRDFWTGFFVGQWHLGSGLAVNEHTEGNASRNEYLYVGSNEVLQVNANGTYVWTTSDKKQIRGRWSAQKETPGIVILKGVRGRDYEFYNATNDATARIMKEQHARLRTEGIMETLARRPLSGAAK